MRRSAFACSFLLPLVLAYTPSVARAQASDVGLVGVANNTRAGAYCAAVSCSAKALTVSRGSTLTLTTYGSVNSPYVLALGFPTTTCVTIPGFENQLMLGAPILVFRSGVTGKGSTISICLIGSDVFSVNVPSNSATGTIHLQALAQSLGKSSPAFTSTLAVTIQ